MRRILTACLLLLAGGLAAAEPVVAKAWSRASLPGQEAGVGFAVVTGGDVDDQLTAAESPAARFVELHEHVAGADGVMAMREVVGGIAVPARATVELKPRSYHVMLIGLAKPLAKGAKVPFTFVFAKAGRIAAEAEVLDPWSMTWDDR